MRAKFFAVVTVFMLILFTAPIVRAQKASPSAAGLEVMVKEELDATPAPTETPTPTPRTDLTQERVETTEPLKKILNEQELGSVFPFNPVKYAIRNAVGAGVPINTIVLLLLLPGVAGIIAATRHLVGVRGFGILMPASLSVVFLAVGPILGIALFLAIVVISTFARFILRKSNIRLQYLPRMSLILLFVVIGILGILFLAPITRIPELINVSIFPVLFLVLLAEDFTRVQLGKSLKVAANLTTETLILSVFTFLFLTLKPVQSFVLLHPEMYIVGLIIFDIVMGKYINLRFIELWRFRRLITK